jgi:hypothetical protein
VPVACLRVNGRDDAIGGDLASDPHHPVSALLQVLAEDRSQQHRGLGGRLGQLVAVQVRQDGGGVDGAGVQQRLPQGGILPIDARLGRRGVVVPAAGTRPQRGRKVGVGGRQQPRTAERSSVRVSIVATASYNGVESSTRRTPTSPACRAAWRVTSKIRLGRSEAASRARMSTSTVWLNPG